MTKRIPPFSLILQPEDDEAKNMLGFEWAPGSVGTRHRIGGHPQFIQREDWPVCAECGERMTFYAQLDSLNDEFVIADCGMIYVFVCFECVEVEAIVQSN